MGRGMGADITGISLPLFGLTVEVEAEGKVE